ncbi:nuclear factor of activated T-cells 5 isoform X2 [Halyomorpha halys]|uniref:nuclear factor of activated T-cells 5 isoform X2 n=1 Tax=Halyomorpha halys TaxID=286706 RepID=UPI0006D4FFE5|nr:nuclear factor of activated T-cells 5 isoform X2 [Halyomorpha halys]
MLLKYTQYQKRSKFAANGQPHRTTGTMKILNGKGKGYRKGVKCTPSKRMGLKMIASKREEMTPVTMDPCDNSNDSGLGFDHIDFPATHSTFSTQEYCWGNEESKKRRYDVKLESDNANDNFTFPQTRIATHQSQEAPLSLRTKGSISMGKGKGSKVMVGGSQGFSRNGKVQLQIISQPEMQHRARYQTEGSRGAVKDRSGNSFPIVKLSGYNKPATLEVYIGTDQGRVAPHMFYQACRVSGKNSTPCIEKKVDGTVLIEIELDPAKDMTVTCDCVGILKERNVDVEHRFPEESSGRSKKKSTRCRMVFRTTITHDDNTVETVQVTSQPIICTQPPGVPEICKKSLTACPANGGLELFILGKNFLKDTRVSFSLGEPGSDLFWESIVQPDKEFLQQSHLVCSVPPFRDTNIREVIPVRLSTTSGGRCSEPHTFFYTPVHALPEESPINNRASAQGIITNPVFPPENVLVGVQWHVPMQSTTSFISEEPPKSEEKNESEMMPPPATVPPVRRNPTVSSEVKREAESPPCLASALQQFITPDVPLPSISVENYLSRIESPPEAQVTAPQSQKLVGGEKVDQLMPLSIPQLSLATQQSLAPIGTASQLIMDTKLTGLLNADAEPMITSNDLLYSSATSQVVSPPVPPVLLEGPAPVQDFVPQQNNTVQPPEYNVATNIVLTGHNNTPMIYPENLTVNPSAALPPAFPTILSEPVPLAVYPNTTKNSEKIVKSEFQTSILQNMNVEKNQKAPIINPGEKKCDEGIPLPQELTQMSEHDLLSYINPSCFDQVC